MLDIKFVRENPEIVKQNIRNKFQDSKLELVDKVLELDKENREIKQEVEALPRKFVRFFLAGACECEIDKQGRILIPANLREFAKLEKEAVLVGVSNRIEIWSRDKWEEINDVDVDDMDDIAQHMEDIGISL